MGKRERDQRWSSGPNSLLKQGHLAQNCIKMLLEFISDLPVSPPGLVFLISVKRRQTELQIRKSFHIVSVLMFPLCLTGSIFPTVLQHLHFHLTCHHCLKQQGLSLVLSLQAINFQILLLGLYTSIF